MRCRPAEESEPKEPARAEPIYQASYGKLGKRVGPKKSGQQQTHLRDRNSEVVLNDFVRHGQGSSINIIESAPRNEEGDRPALDGTDSRRRSANRRVDSDLRRGLDHVKNCNSAEFSESFSRNVSEAGTHPGIRCPFDPAIDYLDSKSLRANKVLHSLIMLCGDKITVDTSEAYSTRGRIRIHVNRKYHVKRILPEQAVAFAGGGLEANTVDGGCSMMAYGLDMRTVELTVVRHYGRGSGIVNRSATPRNKRCRLDKLVGRGFLEMIRPKIAIALLVLQHMEGIIRILWVTATMARFLPLRAASLRNWTESLRNCSET